MKDKVKVNTEKLNQWISPSREILKPKVININASSSPIMSEEEFDKIMKNV
tara:strand:- start:248 stop:400 length:153 start_codon:yes stop_codon:yes gene_type:complete